jgi:hypothetical protein
MFPRFGIAPTQGCRDPKTADFRGFWQKASGKNAHDFRKSAQVVENQKNDTTFQSGREGSIPSTRSIFHFQRLAERNA